MVELMLDGLRADSAIKIYHVDAKLSETAAAIGRFTPLKFFRLLKYCSQALWYRFARGIHNFYYIPAPGKRNALYRDWIVLMVCRPWFKRIIFHWHAVGLGHWVENEACGWERWITHRLFDGAALSIVLSEFGRADVMRFLPRKIEIVPNGIPDPCPDFAERLRRIETKFQTEERRFIALFAGACTEAKGLFVTLEAVVVANQKLKEQRASISLIVAGEFVSSSERNRFNERTSRTDLNGGGKSDKIVDYVGFVSGRDKADLFQRCDCLCFPSLYSAEGQPVTIIEALAFDLPVVATRWRGIPELLSGANALLIDGQDPQALATALMELATQHCTKSNRHLFLAQYSLDKYVHGLARAFETAVTDSQPDVKPG